MGEILKSKRVRITIVGLVVWAAARFGLDLDPEAVDKVLDLAMVLVGSFALTGLGKERIAEAAKTGGSITSIEVTTTIPPPVAPSSPALPPLPGARHGPTPTPTTGDMSETARRLREEAKSRTPAPPLPAPPRRGG